MCGEETAELQQCMQCRGRSYCGRACQRKDWKEMGHKQACKAILKARRGCRPNFKALLKTGGAEEVRGLIHAGVFGVNDL